MRGLALAALVVLTLGAATARADSAVPAGFTLNPTLSKPAAFVAGKPVTVYCAPSAAAIDLTVSSSAQNVQGVTPVVGGNVIYLSPLTCSFANAWLAGKKPKNLYGVAVALQTIAHEAEHTAGISDETDADCASLKAMPAMVLKFFPLRGRETLHRMMADAWTAHGTKSAVFKEHAC